MVFGVPPEMVAAAVAGQSVTYSNIETKPLALLKFGVGPWLVGLQAGLDDLLPGGIVGRFDPAGLLRADLKTRCQSYQIAIDGGWLTVDEVRARRVGAAGSGRPAAVWRPCHDRVDPRVHRRVAGARRRRRLHHSRSRGALRRRGEHRLLR